MNKEFQDKKDAEKKEQMTLEKKEIAFKEKQLRADRESREAAERPRNEEREIERLGQAKNDLLIAKIKKIGYAVKHILPNMPNDMMEVPLYLETVENAFRSFGMDIG